MSKVLSLYHAKILGRKKQGTILKILAMLRSNNQKKKTFLKMTMRILLLNHITAYVSDNNDGDVALQ